MIRHAVYDARTKSPFNQPIILYKVQITITINFFLRTRNHLVVTKMYLYIEAVCDTHFVGTLQNELGNRWPRGLEYTSSEHVE